MAVFREIVLIIFSCLALIIALRCLFFMVPLKRFMLHIRSLGGGMQGIEAHVKEVLEEVRGELAQLEAAARQQTGETREAVQGSIDRVARDNRETQRELEKMRKDLQSLQAELRGTASDARKVAQSIEGLTKELQQLRGDFDGLDPELRASVRRLVADSFNTVESTVLSALEAVQEEMLYGVSKPPESTKPFGPRQEPPRPSRSGREPPGTGPGRRTRENIITMTPLFPGVPNDELEGEEEGKSASDAQREGGDEEADGAGESPEGGEGET